MIDEAVAPFADDPSLHDEHAAPAHRRSGGLRATRTSRRSSSIATASRCISRARRFRIVRDGQPGRAGLAPRRAVRLSARVPAARSRRCRRPRSSAPRRSNSCARSNTASASRRIETQYDSIGVDTPDDLERVRADRLTRSRRPEGRADAHGRRHSLGRIDEHRTEHRPVKYILVTGGVVSSLGKGLAAASIGALLEGHGYKVALQKFDPYINVDPGHDEPVPARRGLRHRRRRGDGPRPRPLRALHQPGHDAQQQLDDRQDLPVGHPEGAPRRLPGAHRPGHPAHHQRDQGQHPRRRAATSTSSSSRSAARSATSRACRSSRRSASCARTSAARTRSTST